jgi:predicted enzyme related to lactoylglutathione lyase
MRNAVYWVELPVNEFDRAKQFYETVSLKLRTGAAMVLLLNSAIQRAIG